MDLNFVTWLLVTYVFFQMYITPTLIQSTLHFTLSVGGEEVPCNLTQVIFDTPKGTLIFGKTITTFYEFV
jgi:hypothetical protein